MRDLPVVLAELDRDALMQIILAARGLLGDRGKAIDILIYYAAADDAALLLSSVPRVPCGALRIGQR